MVFSRKEIQAVIAELVGMMLFVYTGVGTAHMALRNSPFHSIGSAYDSAVLTISLAFGLGITCFVYATAGVSGGHLNPAVSISLMAIGKIRPGLTGLYVAAQFVGATFGSMLAAFADPYVIGYAVNTVQKFPSADKNAGVSDLLAADVSGARTGTMWGQAFCVEFVGTFMLVFTVCMTAVNKSSIAGNCAPIAIGLSVFFAHLTAIPITNCSINPARSFGAALAQSMFDHDGSYPNKDKAWEQIWFFLLVPVLGGLGAALVFHFAFSENNIVGGLAKETKTEKTVDVKNPLPR